MTICGLRGEQVGEGFTCRQHRESTLEDRLFYKNMQCLTDYEGIPGARPIALDSPVPSQDSQQSGDSSSLPLEPHD